MNHVYLVFFVTVLSLLPAALRGEETYYLSPEGHDENVGSRQAPWQTLQKASREAEAGDTVILLPGAYQGVLHPVRSGSAEHPITFRASKRRTVQLTGTDGEAYAVRLDSLSHIRLEGLHIRPRNPAKGRWVKIVDADYIIVDDCLIEKTAGGGGGVGKVPFVIGESEHVQLLGSILRETIGGDLMHVYNSIYVKFEGNAISRAGHNPMAFSPRIRLFKQTHYVVMRSNIFHAGWGCAFAFLGEPNVLFEGTIVAHSYHGALSAGPGVKIMLENGLVRFNRVFRNWGAPLNLAYYNLKTDAHDTALDGNVFDHNYTRALRIQTVNDHIFKNNIFSRNDPYGGGRQLLIGAERSSFVVENNSFWAGGKKTIVDAGSDRLLTLEEIEDVSWRQGQAERRDNIFRDNVRVRPGYRNPDTYDHALTLERPLRDRGQPLTTARGSGTGKTLPVEDVRYFYDGYGFAGEEGDLVAVGASGQVGRVQELDRERNTLTLDRQVTWSTGDPVGLPWAGPAPDLGVYEHGREGRVSVQVVTNPFIARPGEPVTLRAVVRGDAEPAAYHWKIGDYATANGQEVTHRFEDYQTLGYSPTGVPIFCRVEMNSGRRYLAAGFVELGSANPSEEPFVHLSFDEDPFDGSVQIDDADNNWWWFRYRSRPNPDVETVLEYEEDGHGVVRFTAPEDEQEMGVRAWPARWNIDRYPTISFRYKMDADLPLGLYLQAFDKDGKERRVYVAVHEQLHRPAERARVGEEVFAADSSWHTRTLDARLIKRKYPDVQYLEKIRYEAIRTEQVEEGRSFWLDEFYIVPEDYQIEQEDH
jgi:hypothetical protein